MDITPWQTWFLECLGRSISGDETLLGSVADDIEMGELTASSQDTAYRDILDLMERGILVRSAESGRSTSYFLAEESHVQEGRRTGRRADSAERRRPS